MIRSASVLRRIPFGGAAFLYAMIVRMKKILLVADDQFLGSLMKNRLVKEGFDLVWATSGDEAIAELKAGPADLILMDIILPGYSGFEALEKIVADPQCGRVPVMIISNLGQESDVARGRQLGVVAYLVKAQTPIDELVRRVREFLKV